jgi:hypothetical protein
MRLLISQVGGRAIVADADTGKPLDWPEQVGIDLSRATPFLWLGTSKFSGTLTAPPVVPVAPAPVPVLPTR